jgi:hypothetical protein
MGRCLHTDGDQLGNIELMEQCLHAGSDEVKNFELIEHRLHADYDHAGKLWIDGALSTHW